MGRRGETPFVVAPGANTYDLKIKVVDTNQYDSTCEACGHGLDPAEHARKLGREFMQMVLARAKGQFWDGMREVMQERGHHIG